MFEGDAEFFSDHDGPLAQIVLSLGDMNPEFASTYFLMSSAMRLMHKNSAAMFKSAKISQPQATCLIIIDTFEGLSQRELGQKLGVASSSITVMLRRLENTGYIVKTPDSDDQRIVRLFLSEYGKRELEQIKKVQIDFINSLFERISPEGMQGLRGFLEELNQILAEKQEHPR
jgi:DNA-binding MarR family transcriptional regulator